MGEVKITSTHARKARDIDYKSLGAPHVHSSLNQHRAGGSPTLRMFGGLSCSHW